jgi:hypothetical protein
MLSALDSNLDSQPDPRHRRPSFAASLVCGGRTEQQLSRAARGFCRVFAMLVAMQAVPSKPARSPRASHCSLPLAAVATDTSEAASAATMSEEA